MSSWKISSAFYYGIALSFFIAWGILFSVANFGRIIHVLFVIALVAMLLKVIRTD